MKALKITDSDSTCFEATMSRGFNLHSAPIEEWTAVPDSLAHAISVVDVAAKGGSGFIRLRFPDGNGIEIKSFCSGSPEEALQEAKDELAFNGADESNLEWWEDCR